MTNEKDFLMFAKSISDNLIYIYNQYYQEKLTSGKAIVDCVDESGEDIKGIHKIDILIKDIILQLINRFKDPKS